MAKAEAIQIIKPVEHLFQLEQMDTLNKILEADDVKDRYVAVISIAGAYRKGKSFLLNFLLKYLYAQYKRHNVSNWIDSEIDGFKSRGGRQPETTGIWIWSEIFTHDHANGEKIAIILMDTQGIFDSRSSMKDNTVIFALSMMLSSVQCYNVSQNIQEDDLQHLQLFAGYGRLAMQQNSDKPFQSLLFIVRDWPYEVEHAYGNGKDVVDELLTETREQSDENHQLRRQLKASFGKIGAFLMPHPGTAVATGRFTGNINEIGAEFIEQLNALIPFICGPENIDVKTVSGAKVRAREFQIYLKTYIEIFNSSKLPEPQSILTATATARCLLLFHECFNLYTDSMNKYLQDKSQTEDQPYFTDIEISENHDLVENQSLTKFRTTPKLGTEQVWNPFESKLRSEIAQKFKHFQKENIANRNRNEAKMKTEIGELFINSTKSYTDAMHSSVSAVDTFLSEADFENAHTTAKTNAISTFEKGVKASWRGLLYDSTLNKLESNIQYNYLKFQHENEKKQLFIQSLKDKSEQEVQKAKDDARIEELKHRNEQAAAVNKNIDLIGECLSLYMNSMRSAIQSHQSPEELKSVHENSRSESLSKFDERAVVGGDEKMFRFRLENDIESSLKDFAMTNEMQRRAEEDAEERQRMSQHMSQMQAELAELKKKKSSGCSIL